MAKKTPGEIAYEQGRAASRAGRAMNSNPYGAGADGWESIEYQSWNDGFADEELLTGEGDE
jgi:hypothetical protein